jgi:hypothetical protein
MKKGIISIEEINDTLDKLKEQTDMEMDQSVLSDQLSDSKIRRIATERITIKRIRNIFNQLMEEHE